MREAALTWALVESKLGGRLAVDEMFHAHFCFLEGARLILASISSASSSECPYFLPDIQFRQ